VYKVTVWFLQAFAQLSDEFEPLFIGCQENRRNWQITAEYEKPEKRQTNKIEPSKT